MAIKDVLKVTPKTFLNPTGWFGLSSVKYTTLSIWASLKNLIVPMAPERQETFEEALERFNLSIEDIAETQQRYLLFALLFLSCAIFAVIASVYFLFIHATFSGFLLGLSVTALLLSQAFRYHFWYFQIKHKKLGCTFDEWRQGKINSKQGPNA